MLKIPLLVLYQENQTLVKKDVASDLMKIAPRQPGLNTTLRNRLNRLKDRPEPKDSTNDL